MSVNRNEVRGSTQGQRLGSFDHNIDGKYFQVASNNDRTKCFIAYKILLSRSGLEMATVEYNGTEWEPARGIHKPKDLKHTVGDSFCVCYDPNDSKRRLMFFILEDGSGEVYMRIQNPSGTWEEPTQVNNMRVHRYCKLTVTINKDQIFLFSVNESSELTMRSSSYKNGNYTFDNEVVTGGVQAAGDTTALYHNGRMDVVYRTPDGSVAGSTRPTDDSKWGKSYNLIAHDQISRKSPMALTRDGGDNVTLFYLKIQEGTDSRVPTIYAIHLVRTTEKDKRLKNDLNTPNRVEMVGRIEPSSNLGAAFVNKPGKTPRSYLFSVSKTDGQNVLVMRERTKLLASLEDHRAAERWIIPNLLHTDPDPKPIGGI